MPSKAIHSNNLKVLRLLHTQTHAYYSILVCAILWTTCCKRQLTTPHHTTQRKSYDVYSFPRLVSIVFDFRSYFAHTNKPYQLTICACSCYFIFIYLVLNYDKRFVCVCVLFFNVSFPPLFHAVCVRVWMKWLNYTIFLAKFN